MRSVHFATWSVIGAASLLSACGVAARGELTSAECRDGRNNDGDKFKDCEDPDCWVFDFCAADAQVIGQPTQHNDGALAGSSGAAGARSDSAVPPISGDGGAVIPPVGDGAVPTKCSVDGGTECGADQTCVLGACVSNTLPPEGEGYVLRIPYALVPDQSSGTLCFDALGANGPCSVSPAFLCGNCKPDPYVITELNQKVYKMTTPVTDSVTPAWSDAAFEITLKPDDVLKFIAMDDDIATDDQVLFTCTPDITKFKTTSVLQCPPDDPSRLGLPPPGGKFAITIESAPLVPGAE